MKVIPRHLATRVERALGTSRVVNIVGPRQAGKTTLVKDLIATARYVTLDDDAMRAALETDPYGQLLLLSEQTRNTGRPIVIDEVQRLPEITLALKRIVDADHRPGQYVLTGSSDIFTAGKAYDSLAGRVLTLTLRPLSAAEIAERAPCRLLDAVGEHPQDYLGALPKPVPFTRVDVIDLMVRGGFPEIRKLDDPDRVHRYMSYLDSIVERDVSPIAEVRKPDTMRRLIDQMAVRTAEELSIAALCNVLGARKETVNDYFDILSRLGIVHRLGAWTSSGGKREIRAPKLHFLDTGCATSLRGEDRGSFGLGADPVALGHLLESFVFIELEKSLSHLGKRWRLYHWRQHAREIDIVAEAPGRLLALFEMKAAATVGADDFRHINWFLSEGPGKSYRGAGFVVYLGEDLLSFGAGRIALPLSVFWSFVT
ncbi:MAG: ATP-binding protein [Candidatus Melainabacteria bacterium]|nr:ATP-binding protein [Candidatus Melainabacteria bacterium]